MPTFVDIVRGFGRAHHGYLTVQTELHRHLDVSLRTSTLLHLAQAKGLEPRETTYDQFREKLIIRYSDYKRFGAQTSITFEKEK